MDDILFIIIVLIIIIALSIIIYCNRNNIATYFFKKENYKQSSNKKKVKFNTDVKMFKYVPRNVNTIAMSDDVSNRVGTTDSATSVNNTTANKASDSSSSSSSSSMSTSSSTSTDINDYDDFTNDEISDVDGNQILFDPANSSYEELFSDVNSQSNTHNRTREENRWDNNFKDKLVSDKDRQAYIKKLARENNNYVRSLKKFSDKKEDVIVVNNKCIHDSKTFDNPKFKGCTIGQIYDKFTQNKIIISKKPETRTQQSQAQVPIMSVDDSVDYDKLYLGANFGNGF
jgi:hypothetical protein